MNRFLIASLATGVFAATAFAADLPSRRSPPPPATPAQFSNVPLMASRSYDWSGFYAGLNAGYGWNTSNWSSNATPAAFASSSMTAKGIIAGGQVGYNYQMNNIVVGLEGRGQYSGAKTTAPCAVAAGATCSTQQKWLADISGRLGYASDRALVYVSGGYAFTNYTFTQTQPTPIVTWTPAARSGWTAGAGVEYAVTNNLIYGLEYKYYDFGTKASVSNTTPSTNIKLSEKENVILARLSYKFGGPSSVTARY